MVFIENDPKKTVAENDQVAKERAIAANKSYWTAIQGTIDPARLAKAVDNGVVGHPETVVRQMKERFHSEDRLMLWFDFNNHDNEGVCRSMTEFMKSVAPQLT